MTAAPRYALTTVADAAFARGAEVLLDSFLHHNAWFEGDLVVLTDDPAAPPLRRLDAFPRLLRRPVGTALVRRLDALVAALPALAPRRARFHSLDAFALRGYDRVLYLDADVVCRGDVRPLFETDAALLACPDRSLHEGAARDARTYRKVAPATPGVLAAPFNAGVLSLGPALLDGAAHARLLEAVTPEVLAPVTSGHTDQYLLNRLFDDVVTLVDARYNHLSTQTPRPDAVLLHVLGRPKPWQAYPLGRRWRTRRRRWAPWFAAAAACDRRRLRQSPGPDAVGRYGYSRLLQALSSF